MTVCKCTMAMFENCTTALVTPMNSDGSVDYDGLKKLVNFQANNGVVGLLACGTTGESPTLYWDEHNRVIEKVLEFSNARCVVIAGTGSNSTEEALRATGYAWDTGVRAALLVDPYYNGPSSLEMLREYYIPICSRFPEMGFIPYIIPGRTGAQLFPQNLAALASQCPNVQHVKEATGSFENMRLTRKFCGPSFTILSGDDDKTLAMMGDELIGAKGVISVASNIAPSAVQQLCQAMNRGDTATAERINASLKPLFNILTVITQENTPYGPVSCRARNPLAVKTLMNILGMPSGKCRQPLGRMTGNGLAEVVTAARNVQKSSPEVFTPIEKEFEVSVQERLSNPKYLEGLAYD